MCEKSIISSKIIGLTRNVKSLIQTQCQYQYYSRNGSVVRRTEPVFRSYMSEDAMHFIL